MQPLERLSAGPRQQPPCTPSPARGTHSTRGSTSLQRDRSLGINSCRLYGQIDLPRRGDLTPRTDVPIRADSLSPEGGTGLAGPEHWTGVFARTRNCTLNAITGAVVPLLQRLGWPLPLGYIGRGDLSLRIREYFTGKEDWDTCWSVLFQGTTNAEALALVNKVVVDIAKQEPLTVLPRLPTLDEEVEGHCSE